MREDFHKHRLHQVFLTGASGQVRPHDFEDEWIELVHELTRRIFIVLPNPPHAAGHVEGDLFDDNGLSTALMTVHSRDGYVVTHGSVVDLLIGQILAR
jgi:hypothetical protein